MQGHLAVGGRQGSVLETKWFEEGFWLVLAVADSGLTLQEQCRGVLRWADDTRMVEIKSKSLFLREGAFFHFFRVFRIGFYDLLRKQHSSFSCSWDGAQSLSLP
jgi:hypothetical protein